MELPAKVTILVNRLADELIEDEHFNKDKYAIFCNLCEFSLPKLQRQNFQVEDNSLDQQPVITIHNGN